jgi:hypothetical protein
LCGQYNEGKGRYPFSEILKREVTGQLLWPDIDMGDERKISERNKGHMI